MKLINRLLVSVLALMVCPGAAIAQSSGSYHPVLEDKLYLSVGAFFPEKDFKVRVDGTVPGEEIDFEEALRIDDSETTWAFNVLWRFGEKWHVAGQYWQISDSNTYILEEDLEWENVIFQEGTTAAGGVGLDIARIFFGRNFWSAANYEFGAGAGFHWLEIDAYIEGQILTDLGDTEFYRGSVEYDVPLPNIGAWYTYSWSPKWALLARVDWLSASIGDYSGGLWNVKAGVNWAFTEHFGIGATWNFFKLEGDVDKSDWRGKVESEQSGPYVALTATW
jgi:hypothetical protein